MVVRRVEALGKFLDTDDGKNLLAGTKRASNILAIEEKRDKRTFDGAPNPALYSLAEEKALAKAIDQAEDGSKRCRRERRFRRRDERDRQSCVRRSMPSSTRSRSMTTTQRCARTA